MRGAGLSARKCEYLRDLAAHFDRGLVHVRQWQQMDDEAIIDELVAIRGIGRWTAEMFLIFHLMRPNVMPLDDLGLIKGISVNYFSGEPVTRAEAREVGEAWAPFRSVATWYVWRSLDPLACRVLSQRGESAHEQTPLPRVRSNRSPSSTPRSKSCATCRTSRRSTSPKRSTAWTRRASSSRRTSIRSLTPWQVTQIARHPQRPYTLDYVGDLFTDFNELHGDRSFADDLSIVGGLARFNGQACMVHRPAEGPRHQGARGCATSA